MRRGVGGGDQRRRLRAGAAGTPSAWCLFFFYSFNVVYTSAGRYSIWGRPRGVGDAGGVYANFIVVRLACVVNGI